MGRSILGLFALLGLAAFVIWMILNSPVDTATQTQRVAIDNHTTITVINNPPPDLAGAALVLLSVAVLLLVIVRYVLPYIRTRKRSQE